MLSLSALITIIGMASVTYLTRLIGYFLLKNRVLSQRTRIVLESAPGCVIISVIAPYFVSPHPEMIIAMVISAACATRFSMLPTLVISVASLGILKFIFGA